MSPQISDSWVEATIGEVITTVPQREPSPTESFSYIDIASIDRNTKRISNPQKLIGENAPSRARQVVASGDVLVSMTRPNLNAVAMVTNELDGQIASTGFEVLRAAEIDPRWLFYFVRTEQFVSAMSDLVQGALYPAIRPKDICGFALPLAPFPEQKRIADKLDSLLAKVDTCQAHLDRLPQILKRFRQAVLAAATSGRLTEEWRSKQKLNITDWEKMDFESASIEITVGYVGKMASEYCAAGVPFLRSLNVRPFRYAPQDLKYISRDFHNSISKSSLRPGDVVIVRSGAPGQCCVIPPDLPEANCSDLVIVRPGPKLVPSFACVFINSEVSQSFVRSEQVGVAQQHFNTGSMKKAPLWLPSLAEQKEIVRRVEKLFAYADRLEARYQAAQARVTQLTPSLLAKAFRGELVPQDPEDEPAEALLARIRAGERKGEASAIEQAGFSGTLLADASPLPETLTPPTPTPRRRKAP